MEIQIIAFILASFVLTISSRPKHSDIIPKEYYKRQILQPIPGYIPVYIKTDGEPVVRSESQKPSSNVYPQKVAQLKEKNLSKQSDKELLSKIEGKKIIKDLKNVAVKLPDETEPKLENSPHRNENPQTKPDIPKFNKKLENLS